jgi:hypothetical protein
LGVDFGVCNSFGLIPKFLDGGLYPKNPLASTPHFSDCDLNLETLEDKCIER